MIFLTKAIQECSIIFCSIIFYYFYKKYSFDHAFAQATLVCNRGLRDDITPTRDCFLGGRLCWDTGFEPDARPLPRLGGAGRASGLQPERRGCRRRGQQPDVDAAVTPVDPAAPVADRSRTRRPRGHQRGRREHSGRVDRRGAHRLRRKPERRRSGAHQQSDVAVAVVADGGGGGAGRPPCPPSHAPAPRARRDGREPVAGSRLPESRVSGGGGRRGGLRPRQSPSTAPAPLRWRLTPRRHTHLESLTSHSTSYCTSSKII